MGMQGMGVGMLGMQRIKVGMRGIRVEMWIYKYLAVILQGFC